MINKYGNSGCQNDNRNVYNGLLFVIKTHCCMSWFHNSSVGTYTWKVVEMHIIVTLVNVSKKGCIAMAFLINKYRQTQVVADDMATTITID